MDLRLGRILSKSHSDTDATQIKPEVQERLASEDQMTVSDSYKRKFLNNPPSVWYVPFSTIFRNTFNRWFPRLVEITTHSRSSDSDRFHSFIVIVKWIINLITTMVIVVFSFTQWAQEAIRRADKTEAESTVWSEYSGVNTTQQFDICKL